MTTDGMGAMRNTPKQERSHRKVEHILGIAETLIAEVGFENATTNMIATRAGVSVGTLYQFFKSKEAILEEMATRYLVQANETLVQTFEDTASLPLREAIRAILNLSVKQQEKRPYFLQSPSVSSPSSVLIPLVTRLGEVMVQNTATLVARYNPDVNAKQAMLRARIMVKATGAMMPLAIQAKGRERQGVLDEITNLLEQYASTSAPNAA
jgi:AcrR family transcriptional regulator